MDLINARPEIVRWGYWGVTNHAHFTYSEGPERMSGVHLPGHLPWIGDCSAWVECCFSWARLPDPSGLNYVGWDNSKTLFNHGHHIPAAQVMPGDAVVYGNEGSVHAALVVSTANGILCSSMGQQGDPSIVADKVLQSLGIPTYLRFDTMAPPQPTPAPTDKQIVQAHFLILTDVSFCQIAHNNGWGVFVWDGFHFQPVLTFDPKVTHYANIAYDTKR
jgi:hypothetical protein